MQRPFWPALQSASTSQLAPLTDAPEVLVMHEAAGRAVGQLVATARCHLGTPAYAPASAETSEARAIAAAEAPGSRHWRSPLVLPQAVIVVRVPNEADLEQPG